MEIPHLTQEGIFRPQVREAIGNLSSNDEVTATLPPRGGYSGAIEITIVDPGEDHFGANVDLSDWTRFPARIRAIATELREQGFTGRFLVTHNDGEVAIARMGDAIASSTNNVEAPARLRPHRSAVNPMETALFINGIYESVLEEILAAQEEGAPATFLQPYAKKVIRMLKDRSPTPDSPVPVFVATTDNLAMISYSCEIVGWEDKRLLSDKRKIQVNRYLSRYQPGESDLFNEQEGVGLGSVNLLTVRNLRALDTLFPRSILIKSSDDQPLKERSRSGGWSEVYDVGDLLKLQPITHDQLDSYTAAKVAESEKLSDRELAARLRSAPKVPERVQTVSLGFRRNPDVIVAVLRRAKGTCEKCGKKAPFARKSDGSPYLEVHHWEPLAMGGEDTVENSGALCPNCHRECHHG
jgi:5-methylcytosine-specific restriction protein A